MNIKLLLGILPNTNKYEEVRNALFEEFRKHQEYEKSDELKNYIKLQEEINSHEFKSKVEAIKAQKYIDTPEYKKEKEYIDLKNSQEIKLYNKFKNSGENDWILSYEKSPAFKEILELNDFVNTDEFLQVKQEMSRPGKERFKETDSYLKLQAFTELKNDHQIKNYYKFKKNKGLDVVLKLNGSKEWKHFEKLEALVNSGTFTEELKNLKNKVLTESEQWKKQEEYNQLNNSNNYQVFKKISKLKEADQYIKVKGSEMLKNYLDLEKYIKSDKFFKEKSNTDKQTFEESEAFQKMQAFEELKKEPDMQGYLQFKQNPDSAIFEKMNGSKEWKAFLELEEHVNSDKFKAELNTIKNEGYKQTETYQKNEEYNQLKNNPDFKLFSKLMKLPEAADYIALKGSEKLKNYEELKELVESAPFKQERLKIEKSTFKDTPEYEKELKLKNLKNSADYKRLTKDKNSLAYKNYTGLEGSEKIKNFEDLEKYISTEEFTKVKNYMLLKPEEKYKQSEEYQKEQAYKELYNSENIKWFYSVQKADKFKSVKNLDLTFEDDFTDKKLNKKWITRYFWGDALLKDSFSLATDKHFVTDGKNIEIKDSVLSIVTKKEEVTGKAWDSQLGFINKTFNYTSGLINTSNSFRQKYGLFEAKVKMNPTYPVSHAFWMIADKMVPHIDVVKYDKKIMMNNFWMNGHENVNKNITKLRASKYTSGYFIYSLEWKPGTLTWKLNGETVTTQTIGVPDEAMYISFSSGIFGKQDPQQLPATMEIDWVRCYQYKD